MDSYYNYGRLSNVYVDQANSYQSTIMDPESTHMRATAERLGDVGYDCPQPLQLAYNHHDYREHNDSCYNYRSPSYSQSTEIENYQSPIEEYPFEDPECDISGLCLSEENCAAADHSSPDIHFLPVPSSPEMQLPLSPTYWTPYSEDEFSRNMNITPSHYTRAPYGELQAGSGMNNNSHYFHSPRRAAVPDDNITNLGYHQPRSHLDISRPSTGTAICNTSGKSHIKQEIDHNNAISEEKGISTLEPPIDQKNKSVDDRSTGLPTPGRRYKCQVRGCNLHFKRRAEMDRHKESVHQPSSGHLCPIPGCNRNAADNGFSRKDNLRQHLKLKHEMKFPKGRRPRRA